MNSYYSYSPAGQGTGDPEEINVTDVDESNAEETPEHCDFDGDHLVIMWKGGAYSYSNTWISAEDNSVIPLEKAR